MATTMEAESAQTTMLGRLRAGSPALVGAMCFAGATAMFMAGLAGAYLSVRNSNRGSFLPPEMKFNNYAAVLAAMSMLIASIGAGWALHATRFTHRRWMSMGFALAAFMGIASLNLVWTIGAGLTFGVAEHPYAVVVYTLLGAAVVVLAISVGSSLLAVTRCLGGQITAEQPQLGRAAAWVVHIATITWIVVFALIYLYK